MKLIILYNINIACNTIMNQLDKLLEWKQYDKSELDWKITFFGSWERKNKDGHNTFFGVSYVGKC